MPGRAVFLIDGGCTASYWYGDMQRLQAGTLERLCLHVSVGLCIGVYETKKESHCGEILFVLKEILLVLYGDSYLSSRRT